MTAKKIRRCHLCRDTAGWLYDETTDPPTVTRCRCVDTIQSAQQARDEALSTVSWAKPQQMRTAYRIIESEAQLSQYVSANTVRTAMETAQIDGPVRAAAFRRAVAEGLLEPDGEVTSTDVGTHAKRVSVYRSRCYARQLGVG